MQWFSCGKYCGRIFLNSDVYIPHHKYQVKSHSFPWFSATCAVAIVHRNHFFHLHQQNKSSESKVQFRQARNHWKRVLEAAKLAYANKTKESIISQKLGSQDFGELLMFSTKVYYASYYTSYLLYFLYSMAWRWSSAYHKANC